VKFYNYSIKKKENAEPFKPFMTEEAIVEESAEIEELLNAKQDAHSSGDSFENSSEDHYQITRPDIPPELPPPLPSKNKPQTLPPLEKPAIGPKPPLMPKPPRMKTTHKAMKDLRLIDDDKSSEVNYNNLDNHLNSSKSMVVTKKTDFSPTTDNNSNNNTFIEHDNQPHDEEAILRSKKPAQRVTKSDEEVYVELKSICNLSDPLKKYSKTKEVGKGASGVVFIATEFETQNQVAIKTIDLKNQSSKELILNEIRVLIDFNHKNLVNFLEAYYLEESDSLWVVLEYMGG
jgi:p21-activated kinase 1